MENMYNDLAKILISKEEIDKRIKELAAKLDEDYCGKRPLMVCILKGSTMFYADLLRAMTISLEMDFMAISSYGNKTKSSGEVRMIKDLDRSIEGRHLVIVEDIVDSGYTLSYLKNAQFPSPGIGQDMHAFRQVRMPRSAARTRLQGF